MKNISDIRNTINKLLLKFILKVIRPTLRFVGIWVEVKLEIGNKNLLDFKEHIEKMKSEGISKSHVISIVTNNLNDKGIKIEKLMILIDEVYSTK